MISGKISLSVLSLVALLAAAAPPASPRISSNDAPSRPGQAPVRKVESRPQPAEEPGPVVARQAQDAIPPSALANPAQRSPEKAGTGHEEPAAGEGSPGKPEQGTASTPQARASGGMGVGEWGPLLAGILTLLVVILIGLAIYVVFGSGKTTTLGAQERAVRRKAERSPMVTRNRTRPREEAAIRTTPDAGQGKTELMEDREDSRTNRQLDAGASRNATLEATQEAGKKVVPEVEEPGLRRELHSLSERFGHLERIAALASGTAFTSTGSSHPADLDERISALETRLEQLDRRIEGPSRPFPAPHNAGLAAAALQRRIENVERHLHELAELRAPRPNDLAADASPDLELELAVLRASWERTVKELPLLAALGEDAGKALREELLRDLPRAIEVDEELRSACASVLAPVRELENLIRKVSVAQRLVEGTLPPLDQPARQLQRIREGATLLTMLHSSSSFADRLNFRLEQWAGERFLTFADLFLQKRQQALLQGGLPQAGLEEGYRIVLRVLAGADLEPVEIVLGRTLFDSSQHVGRSTACQSGLRDGAIVGVVRNGFRQRGGRVVRQPEVVVNRL